MITCKKAQLIVIKDCMYRCAADRPMTDDETEQITLESNTQSYSAGITG